MQTVVSLTPSDVGARAATPGCAPDGWVREVKSLRFLLGDLRLFARSFPAWVLETHHSRIPWSLSDCPAALPPLGSGVPAALIPSLPVSETFLPLLTRQDGLLCYVPWISRHHVLELHGSLDEYLVKLAAKDRHEMLRKVRRFRKQWPGSEMLREYRTLAELQAFHSVAYGISTATYQHRLIGVGLPPLRELEQEVEALAPADRIRAYVLFGGDQPIAYAFCRAHGSILYYVRTGYDPACRELSPGIVLLHEMLGRLFAERRFELLDFGRGEGRWKDAYATQTTPCATVYFFQDTLANRCLVRAHRRCDRMSESMGRVLSRMGLKERIKRWLRFGMRGT